MCSLNVFSTSLLMEFKFKFNRCKKPKNLFVSQVEWLCKNPSKKSFRGLSLKIFWRPKNTKASCNFLVCHKMAANSFV